MHGYVPDEGGCIQIGVQSVTCKLHYTAVAWDLMADKVTNNFTVTQEYYGVTSPVCFTLALPCGRLKPRWTVTRTLQPLLSSLSGYSSNATFPSLLSILPTSSPHLHSHLSPKPSPSALPEHNVSVIYVSFNHHYGLYVLVSRACLPVSPARLSTTLSVSLCLSANNLTDRSAPIRPY